MPTLFIANKLYSSWSLRPWLLLKQAGIAFDEVQITLDRPDTRADILRVSPAGRVPVLADGDVTVWDSLAIVEYVAERWPDSPVWPADRAARALARSISAEMHSGFGALRSRCPMNLGKHYAWREREGVAADAARVVEIWRDARARFGGGGPFLFGAFTAADAMYAPVVTRFDTYGLPTEADTRAYMDAILSLPAFRAWRADALEETWSVREDEVDEVPLVDHRAVR